MDFRYEFLKLRERLILSFWRRVPNSFLYYGVIQAWSRASTTDYKNKHIDEITWSYTCKYLEKNN